MAATERRRRMDDMDALPEDVLHDVLSRVGNVKDLFMLAVTCRRWLRRFTDRAFLRGVLCPGQVPGHRDRLLGFFFQHNRVLAFLPAPGSPLGANNSVADDDFGSFAEPLAARGGVVLVRLGPPRGKMDTHLSLGICNPVTGERHRLPPLKCSSDADGYAIVTAADHRSGLDGPGRFAFSQLLILTSLTNTVHVHLHSYSAATRSWSVPTVCPEAPGFRLVGDKSSAVVHRGAAHWLWIDLANNQLYKLSAEVGAGTPRDVSVTELPVRLGGSPLLCVGPDGELSVACVYLEHVTFWTQKQAAPAAEWLRTAVIRIPTAVPNPKYAPAVQSQEKWFDFGRGSMLVMYRSSAVFILDLEKKVMEKIMEDCVLPRYVHYLSGIRSVPYEMDLVDFFLLHLGGLTMLRESKS